MAAGLNVRLLGTLDGALDPVQSFVSRPRMTARQRFRRASELPERLVCAADSTGQRNGLAEPLSRRLEAKSLPWPLVQLSR
jgi:hypothetical protein